MHADDDITPIEGLFDAQLDLPMHGAAAPALFATVTKRDGRTEDFQTRKIAAAIARAAAAAAPNEAEHVWDLAKAVRVHLWKQLGERPPHVDQIHEAVERVLVAMARQRTALAYARYRVRRARRREATREGNVLPFLRLDEDEHAREALAGHPGALLVRTSADTLAAWDRGRIVAALARETGLKEHTAEAIALEVEQQIAAARIDALTASLIRELVDAKLAEHGLAEYRERHRRLGVPLYDTALLLRGMLPAATGLGPDATDQLLARVLKKEYALAEVFSPGVAEAHLRGDIHIHALGEIDRFDRAALPLRAVSDHAWAVPGGTGSPARFLAQWRHLARLLRGHCNGPASWRAAAEALDPVLCEFDAPALRQFAEMMLFEFHAPAVPGDAPVEIALGWPAAPPSRAYAEFCRILLDVLAHAAERGAPLHGLLPEVELSAAVLQANNTSDDLAVLLRALEAGVPLRCRLLGGHAPAAPAVYLQTIALNLPRAARHANEIGGAAHWLDTALRAAAQAHEEKRSFLEELWARGADGPLAALRDWPGGADCRPALCPTRIAVDGLHEAATRHGGNEDERQRFAAALLGEVRVACARIAEETGAPLWLAANSGHAISQRFAALEPLADNADTPHAAPGWPPGITFPAATPASAAHAHGELAAYLNDPPPLVLTHADHALLRQLHAQAHCPVIQFNTSGTTQCA